MKNIITTRDGRTFDVNSIEYNNYYNSAEQVEERKQARKKRAQARKEFREANEAFAQKFGLNVILS